MKIKEKGINSSRMPVYRDAGFELYDASTAAEAFSEESRHERDPGFYIYSRYRNPTVVAAENAIMELEEASWALLTQSGMAAVDVAVSVFQNGSSGRPWLFFNEIYGGTISFIDNVLKKRRGVDVRNFFPDDEKYDLSVFENLVAEVRPEFVYLEVVSNPMLIVTDARRVIETARKYGSRVIIDNTFATPQLWKPLEYGADIVIHSVTKYLSGHGNITGGVICGNDPELLKAALEYRKYTGHMMSPDDAYRLSTQIKTFGLRFRRQCENASRLALLLERNELTDRVWYPGLASHITHNEALALFGDRGFGGMITFSFKGSDRQEKQKRRDDFICRVSDRIKLIPSLGDPSTILLPVEPVWGEKYPEPGMIRLSVGFEDYGELERTVLKGLDIS